MSRRRTNDAEVTLLPFLAVLVCTMGALIVLLVVVMQQAQVEGSTPGVESAPGVESTPGAKVASQPADTPIPDDFPRDGTGVTDSDNDAPLFDPSLDLPLVVVEAPAPLENAKVAPEKPPVIQGPTPSDVAEALQAREAYLGEIRSLVAAQEQAKKEIAEKQHSLEGIEGETKRLIAELEQLQQQVNEAATSFADATPTASSLSRSSELTRLQSEIATKQSELAAAQLAASENKNIRYQLVPYNGSQGTTRRPIYVECRGDEVILQPEGVILTIEDFALADDAANPLAATLRAIRNYWLQSQERDSNRGEPYPLLIVRPGGERMYLACRRAMSGWDNEFGYELVEEGIELTYPEKDPTLASIITETRALARQQQAQMLQMIAAMKPNDAPTYRASRGGGFVMDGAPGNSQSRRFGRKTINQQTERKTTSSPSTNRQSPENIDDTDQIILAHGKPGGLDSNVSNEDRVTGGGEFVEFDGSSSPSSVHGPFGGGEFAGTSEVAGRASPMGGPTSGEGLSGEGLSGEGLGGDENVARTGRYDGNLSTDRQENPLTDPNESRQAVASGDATSSYPGTNSFEIPETPEDSVFDGDVGAVPSGQGESPPSDLAFSGVTPSDRIHFGSPPSQGGSQESQAGTSSSRKKRNTSRQQMQFGNATSIAKQRGQDWALPNVVQGAIPAERPLYIALNNAQMVLEAEPGTRQVPAVVTFESGTSSAVQSLVTTIWERISSWGVAGPGVYWRPKLRFDIAPGAEPVFKELSVLLEGSGLELQKN